MFLVVRKLDVIMSKSIFANDFVYIYKMKKLLFLTVCLLISGITKAQKVFTVEYSSQADVKIFVVDYESQADLCVYKVDYSSQTGKNDGNWFFVDYSSQADKKIFFTDYSSQADVLIYFVDYKSQAKWKKKEKIHLFY